MMLVVITEEDLQTLEIRWVSLRFLCRESFLCLKNHTLIPSFYLHSQPQNYSSRAKDILNSAWGLINSPDWQLEKEMSDGAFVHSKSVSKGPKLFRLTAKVNLPASMLLNQLFDLIEEMPSWNPTVIESHRLEVADLIYSIQSYTFFKPFWMNSSIS